MVPSLSAWTEPLESFSSTHSPAPMAGPVPPQRQLPEVSLNPYVGFGSSCFWLCSVAGDLRGGCVICTAVIRVIARYFPKLLLQLQACFPNFLPVHTGSGERDWLKAFPAAANGTQRQPSPGILRGPGTRSLKRGPRQPVN